MGPAQVRHARNQFGQHEARLWIPCHPRPKGNSKRIINRPGAPRCRVCRRATPMVVATESERAYEKALVMVAQAANPGAPFPFRGPVWCCVRAVMPIPTRWRKFKQASAAAGLVPHVSVPDRVNLLKMIEDVLEHAGYVENDSRFDCGPVSKHYGAEPGFGCWLIEQEIR